MLAAVLLLTAVASLGALQAQAAKAPASNNEPAQKVSMLGGKFTIMDYLIWNEIPTVVGNLVGGITFVGLSLYSTHYKTAPKRVLN